MRGSGHLLALAFGPLAAFAAPTPATDRRQLQGVANLQFDHCSNGVLLNAGNVPDPNVYGQGIVGTAVPRHVAIQVTQTTAQPATQNPPGINPPVTSLAGYTTYRVEAELGPDALSLYSMTGVAPWPLIFPAAYQNANGRNVGGVSSAIIEIVGIGNEAQFDSWLSVGPTNGDPQNKLSSVGITFDTWATQLLTTSEGGVMYTDANDATHCLTAPGCTTMAVDWPRDYTGSCFVTHPTDCTSGPMQSGVVDQMRTPIGERARAPPRSRVPRARAC